MVSVIGVRVLARYWVELDFDTDETRVLDLEPLFTGRGGLVADLMAEYSLFCQVFVDTAGGTIAWPNGLDWAPDELYARSRPSTP